MHRWAGRRSWALGAVAVLLGAATACGSASAGGTATLGWYIFPEPSGAFAQAARECSQASNGEYKIALRKLPNDADGQREQMVRRLAAGDTALDILGLDVTWTPEFAEAKWIEPWPADRAAQVEKGTLPAMVDTATWDGRLYSAPFNTNIQLLWYRKDLVQQVPRTWNEMISAAEQLAQQGKPHYIEIQGAQYEGYVVWFNSLVHSAGGQILEGNSAQSQRVALGQPAVDALQVIHDLAHSPAADPSLSNQHEDENRLAFEAGHAPFMLNWPYVYPAAKQDVPKIFQNMGWAVYPSVSPDVPAHPTIGGIDLAVSAYSKHKQQAFDAIQCLRQPKHEITNAIKGGLPPVLEDIYQNPPKDFRDQYPFYEVIYQSLKQASVRPLTPAYQSVSVAIASTLSPPSSVNPQRDVKALRSQIDDALHSKGLIP